VHSIADGEPSVAGVIRRAARAAVKRTVEGDLGMRHNAATIVEAVGLEAIATSASSRRSACRRCSSEITRDVERLPRAPTRSRSTRRWSARRSARRSRAIAAPWRPSTRRRDRSPSSTARTCPSRRVVIGTGGALVHSRDPHAVLRWRWLADEPLSLRPRRPRLLLDREYLLYACGLLGSVEPQARARARARLTSSRSTQPTARPADERTFHGLTLRACRFPNRASTTACSPTCAAQTSRAGRQAPMSFSMRP
jgi:hypothetical protein